MAFDYNKLRGRIVEKFGTQSVFAKKMGVSERTLSLKLNGKVFFTQDEIVSASRFLEIPESEIQVYFFTQQVQ